MNDFNPYTHIPEMPNCFGTYDFAKFACGSCSYAISCIGYRNKSSNSLSEKGSAKQ